MATLKADIRHKIATGQGFSVAGCLLQGESLENIFINPAVGDRPA
ncbi:hypothetical protein [Cylindrospermum sp. FACHB-282]|nr:hypothetical protein [Cylindrospermum sp. FACHB-282]